MKIEWNWVFNREIEGKLFDDIEEVVWYEGKVVGKRSRAKKQRELPSNFDKEIAKAVRFWAKNHPYPDGVSLIAGPKVYTPREIAYHVSKRTKFGRLQLEVSHRFAETIKNMTPEECIQGWYRPFMNSESNE